MIENIFGKNVDVNKINKSLYLVCLLFVVRSSCAANYYISCETSKGILFLRSDFGNLIYEMKSSNDKTFTYFSPEPSYSAFSYYHCSRFQTDYLNVSFSQSGFKYTIFSNCEDGNSSRGVTVVSLKSKKEYAYECKDDGVDRLSDLTSKLQCDKDSSLGCQ